MKKKIYYDEDYFEKGNYSGYTKGWYRWWHGLKFLYIGLGLKFLGIKKVLDFGCADGISVAMLRKLGLEAWGVDISEYAVSKTPKEVRKFVWFGELTEKSFSDDYFDLIVSWDVLEHLPDGELDRVILELKRIGKKGLWSIYVKDEIVTKIHCWTGKTHLDHLSEHEFNWWVNKFKRLGIKAQRLPLSRKGTFVLGLQ